MSEPVEPARQPSAATARPAARSAARRRKAERERRVIGFLNRGVSIAELAAREGVTERGMRKSIRALLARRAPQPPAEFLALQVSRLNETLVVAYSAMSGANLHAVDRVVTIVRELDRYHGFAVAAEAVSPRPPRLAPPSPAPSRARVAARGGGTRSPREHTRPSVRTKHAGPSTTMGSASEVVRGSGLQTTTTAPPTRSVAKPVSFVARAKPSARGPDADARSSAGGMDGPGDTAQCRTRGTPPGSGRRRSAAACRQACDRHRPNGISRGACHVRPRPPRSEPRQPTPRAMRVVGRSCRIRPSQPGGPSCDCFRELAKMRQIPAIGQRACRMDQIDPLPSFLVGRMNRRDSPAQVGGAALAGGPDRPISRT